MWKGRLTFLALLAVLLLTQLRGLLAFFALKASYCCTVSLSALTSRFYSAKLLSNLFVSSRYCCIWWFVPKCRVWHFPLNSVRFYLPFSPAFGVPLSSSMTIWHMSSFKFYITCRLWRCMLNHHVESWMKMADYSGRLFFPAKAEKFISTFIRLIGVYFFNHSFVIWQKYSVVHVWLWMYNSRSCSVREVQTTRGQR